MTDINNKKLKILIIGGSVAGLSAATRARRINELAEITIIDDSKYIGYPISILPAFASGVINKKESVVSGQEEKIIEVYNIRILKNHKATQIDRKEKKVTIKNIETKKISEILYDKLILACGNKFILPKTSEIRSKNIFILKKFDDALNIRSYIEKTAAEEITIIGVNYLGLLTANNFIKKGFKVTIIEEKQRLMEEFDDEFSFLIKNELLKNGANVIVGASIKKLIRNDKDIVYKIMLDNGIVIHPQLVIFFERIAPNIDLANQSSLSIGNTGRIIVNNKMQTQDLDIFAVGNISETFNSITKCPGNNHLIGPAQFQGRVAATNAAGVEMTYTGIIGTKIIKFQNLTIGITGLNKEYAKENGYNIFSLTIYAGNHERFFSGAEQLRLKIIVDKENRKVLGAQVSSKGDGVDKTLDVLATAIYSGLTVDDLINLNLSYSTELSTSKSPINIIAMAAANRLDGLSNTVNMNDIYVNDKICILDIRNKKEYLKSHIESSIWIPLNELRSRLDEIPKDMDIYIYGHIGVRGYIAERILKGSGFDSVFNIEGGLTSIKVSENMR